MIKLRLHGTLEEVKKFSDFLSTLPALRVLSRSEPYPDRNSVYVRIYTDVELKQNEKNIT